MLLYSFQIRYKTQEDLFDAAEQVDSVALAIYQMEKRQRFNYGDMTELVSTSSCHWFVMQY
jgi:hypothetical protein